MKHQTNYDLSTAATVLSMTPPEVAPFLRDSLRDRSLSWIVSDLNHALIHGAEDEREEARKALDHLGFV